MSRIDEALRRAGRKAPSGQGGGPFGAGGGSKLGEQPLNRFPHEVEPRVGRPPAPPRGLTRESLPEVPSRQAKPAAPGLRPVVRDTQPARATKSLDSTISPGNLKPAAERATAENRLVFSPEMNGKIVATDAASPDSIDQYRRLATALVTVQRDRGVRTIMVTSALPGEGRTLTVTNLALTLSESCGQNVLLIDADLGKPSLHELFQLPNDAGVADCLRSGEVQMPLAQVSPRLAVLPAGQIDGDPLEALVSKGMQDFLARAAERFDWILLDTPPVAQIQDSHLLAWMTDGVLLVIGAGATPRKLVEGAIADLGEDRIVGVVLNRAGGRPSTPRDADDAHPSSSSASLQLR